MPSFRKILDIFFILLDIASLIYFLSTADYTMCKIFNNPAFIIFIVAIIATALNFILPAIRQHFKLKKNILGELLLYGFILLTLLLITTPWYNYAKCCSTPPKIITKDSIVIVHDTIRKLIYTPINEAAKKTKPDIVLKNKNGDNNSNTGTNNGNIGGEGNTVAKNVVKGNNYGHNGDVLNEPQLTDAIKLGVLSELTKFKKKNGMDTVKCLIMSMTEYCNAPSLTSDLGKYLETQGYIIGGTGSAMLTSQFNGYTISKFLGGRCIQITVGRVL